MDYPGISVGEAILQAAKKQAEGDKKNKPIATKKTKPIATKKTSLFFLSRSVFFVPRSER